MSLSSRKSLEVHIKATPVTGTVAEMRRAFQTLAAAQMRGAPAVFGAVACATFGHGAPVLWLHGGGYVFGSSRSHADVASALAQVAGCQVVVPNCALAPEHPWPASLEDARRVWHALGEGTPVVGDSAGGHLAMNLALAEDVAPEALVLISPNTDRTGLSRTRAANSPFDLTNDDAQDAHLARIAFGAVHPARPDVSPIYADLRGLPRTYLTASDSEVLFGDAALLRTALKVAGVPVTYEVVPELFHLWPLWPHATPEAAATLRAIAGFLRAGRGIFERN